MRRALFLLTTLLFALSGYAQSVIWGATPWSTPQVDAQVQFATPFVQQAGSNPALADTAWTAVTISDNNGQNVPGAAYWTRSTTGYSQGVNSNNVPLGSPTQANGVALFDSDFLDNGGIMGNQGNGSSPAIQRGELISPVINLVGYVDTALGLKMYMRYDAIVLNELSVSFSTNNGATWGPAFDLTASHTNACEGWSTVLFTDDPLLYNGTWNPMDSCRLKFTFEGAYNYVAIDDVSLFTGNAGWYSSWNNGTAHANTYAVVQGVQCDGGPFTSPSGKVWNSPGVYHDTIANSFSRDSIMTFCVVTGSSSTGVDTITACGSYTWMDGNTYTASNTTATHTLTNASGCDSVVTLNLTIIPLVAETLTITDSSLVCVGTTTVNIANTQAAFDYVLLNDANNNLVDGPVAGTGAALSMNTDTVYNTTTYKVVGGMSERTALVFDGLDEGLTIPNDVALDFDTGTVELWFRVDANDNVNRTLASMRDGLGGATRWSLHYNATQNHFGVYNGNTYATGSSVGIQPGTWNHVAFRMTTSNVEVVVNGSSVGTILAGITSAVTGRNLMIGAHTDVSNDEEWIGAIDDVRVWNVLRSVAQINAAKDSCYTGSEADLLAFYDFEDAGDNTADDLTGNGHHGTLTNMDPATDWVTSGKLCWECSTEMANTVTLNIGLFPADSITTASSIICDTMGGTTTVDISGSAVGLHYALFDTAFTFLTQGVPGSGGPISLTSDTITASTLLGVYVVNTTDASACTAIMPNGHSVSLAAPTGSTDTQTACGSYLWMDGNTYTTSNNTATFVTTNAAGCDSIITLDLTILAPSGSTDTQVACGSYTWMNGVTYTSSNNTATDTLVNSAGCDSIITLNLTINQPSTFTDVQFACGPFTWIDGNTYTTSNNTAADTLVNAAGCDSIVTLDLTIASVINTTDTQVACGAFTWGNGVTYTSNNNTASDTLTSINGCDSIVTLNLTILTATSGTDTQSACGSFTWTNGVTYTASNNTATDTLVNAAGCDSIITLNLTILNATSGTDTQSACGSFTWTNGVTYTASNNTATDTLVNAAGCDSIVTLDLTILSATSGTDTQSACGSFTWIDGVTYTTSNNTATFTLMNAAGCDSIVTLNLTINSVETGVTENQFTLTADAAGATYQWLDCDNGFAPIAGETGQSFTATANGNYAVLVTENTCSDTSTCVNVTGVGLETATLGTPLALYPNPTSDWISISGAASGSIIRIHNLAGQLVYSGQTGSESIHRMQIDNLQAGVFSVSVTTDTGTRVFKLIKQ